MVEGGLLILTATSLSTAITQLEIQGVPQISIPAIPDEPGIVSTSTTTAIDVSAALRLRVEASAAIVDDGWTEPPETLSPVELELQFRHFHSALGSFRDLVEGIGRGFAVERDFEDKLWRAITSKLDRLGKTESDDLIVLHGQSGTGKTVALARLARRIRSELQIPVLVSVTRTPNHADIEAFCLESERLGVPTILICDTNQTPHRYDDLTSACQSRGRRILVVGSCYRLDTRSGGDVHRYIEASTKVSQIERSNFQDLLKKFGHDPILLEGTGVDESQSIFAMLYRRLPASRERLSAGVSSEARANEGLLRERARTVPRPIHEQSQIAQQLIDLGIASSTMSMFVEEESLSALGLDSAGRLIDFVMAAGRLNCSIPVNLVFRTLGTGEYLDLQQILHLFGDLDIFRWKTSEDGSDYLISPRIQLEAELICRRRLVLEQEISRLVELIHNVRLGVDQNAERAFLLDLLTKIVRTGPRGDIYRPGYLQVADSLKALRIRNRIFDPALVLRECVLRRQAVFTSQRDDALEVGTTNDIQYWTKLEIPLKKL